MLSQAPLMSNVALRAARGVALGARGVPCQGCGAMLCQAYSALRYVKALRGRVLHDRNARVVGAGVAGCQLTTNT